MKTNHTTGPWHVTTVPEENQDKLCLYRFQIWQDVGHNHIIAKTVKEYESVDDEANARLIAAAPDLLAGMELALKRLEALEAIHYHGDTATTIQIRAAINKARGK